MKMLKCCRLFWDRVSAGDGVPVFTVVAWDKLAPGTVRHWINEARAAGVNSEKIRRAEEHLLAIEIWQRENAESVKVPD